MIGHLARIQTLPFIWLRHRVGTHLGNMLRALERGTSPFVCTHRTHVAAGTGCKLVHTKQILVHFYVAAETVCESNAYDAYANFKIIGQSVPAS